MAKEGVTMWAREMMYKLVAHKVLLYGIDSWVVTDAMLKVLMGFHYRVDWKIIGMIDR